TLRASGNTAPLAKVLESRRYWIELAFTPIAIALGKLGAVVSAVRLVVKRRALEFIPLSLLRMAVFQYVGFKQGARIHAFWPQTFAVYFALAMGVIVTSAAEAWEAVRARLGKPAAKSQAGAAALALALPPLALVMRDGAPALRYAHETGGR